MNSSDFGRCTLTSCAAAAMLAGCGASQTPIGAPGAAPPTSAIATHAAHGKSWMSAKASKSDLLYISAEAPDGVLVFTYPKAKLVGELTDTGTPVGLCSDAKGNVFVTTLGDYVLEYAHGGTTPKATLSDPGYYSYSCAVDPTTGNLAVANFEGNPSGAPGDVAIYRNAQGTPQLYADPDFYLYEYCGYDNAGNLFVDGRGGSAQFAELRKGSNEFTDITVTPSVVDPTGIQWDGAYLAIGSGVADQASIVRVAVSGSTGTIVDTISLKEPHLRHTHPVIQFSFQGHHLIGPAIDRVGFWRYPKGGKYYKYLQHGFRARELFGSAISRAQ